MLGYDDSKESGLLSGGLLSGATNRWAWLRNSGREKSVVAIALGAVGFTTLLLMSLHSGGAVTTKGSNTEADQLSAACATGAWGQCGGRVGAVTFSADPCCPEGNTCSKRTEEYSQCVPDCQCARHSNRPSPLGHTRPHREPLPAPLISRCCMRRTSHWGQCGGTGFVGNRCCPSDASCIVRSLDFSQCVPSKLPADVVHMSGASFDPDIVSDATCTTGPWTQCGGKYYTGDSCCPKGYSCTYRTEGFSQCARSHSPDAS